MKTTHLLRNFFRGCFLFAVLAWTPFPGFCQAIETQFTLWLANDESRTMQILTHDRQILDRLSLPLPQLAIVPETSMKLEERLWAMHARIFQILPEISGVFRLARRFGSGTFVAVLGKARPGFWMGLTFQGVPTFMARQLIPFLDKRFQEDFLGGLGLDKNSELDISKRLETTLRKMRDSERRLLIGYLDNFLALYPKNRPTRYLASLVNNGLSREFAKGITSMVNEMSQISAARVATETHETPAETASGEAAVPGDPGVASGPDPFSIFQ